METIDRRIAQLKFYKSLFETLKKDLVRTIGFEQILTPETLGYLFGLYELGMRFNDIVELAREHCPLENDRVCKSEAGVEIFIDIFNNLTTLCKKQTGAV